MPIKVIQFNEQQQWILNDALEDYFLKESREINDSESIRRAGIAKEILRNNMSTKQNDEIVESILDELRDFQWRITKYIDTINGLNNELCESLKELKETLDRILTNN